MAFCKFYWSFGNELKYEFLSLLVHDQLKEFTLPIFATKMGHPPACLVRLLQQLLERAPHLERLRCQADVLGAENAPTARFIYKSLCQMKSLQVIKCPYITCSEEMLIRIAYNLTKLRYLIKNLISKN